MPAASSRRSTSIPGSSVGGSSTSITSLVNSANEGIIKSQWDGKSKRLAVERWDKNDPIEYRDMKENRIKYEQREVLPSSVPTEHTTPLFIYNQYKKGQLKKTFLPTKVYECGLSAHPKRS